MGKNTSSAKKAKRSKKGGDTPSFNPKNAPRIDIEDGYQFYARVTKTEGHCRFRLQILQNPGDSLPECVTGLEVLGHLPKSMKRGGWVTVGMIVLISHRKFEHKADIIYKYTDEEVRYLQRKADMPENLDGSTVTSVEDAFVWDDGETKASESKETTVDDGEADFDFDDI